MKTFADHVISFNKQLDYEGELPVGFRVLNPFFDNKETLQVMERFYHKFYHDNYRRRFLIGINPSRHGAGVTGVPFTDTKRLESACGIPMVSARTHEISSVFIYDMIDAYGGVDRFYRDFYINSPFPLAILRQKGTNWVNANYYDDKALFSAVKPFMKASIQKHIALGIDTKKVFVLGKKNADFLQKINLEENFFEEMVALDHPRFIQQYKSKDKEAFIAGYLEAFNDGIPSK